MRACVAGSRRRLPPAPRAGERGRQGARGPRPRSSRAAGQLAGCARDSAPRPRPARRDVRDLGRLQDDGSTLGAHGSTVYESPGAGQRAWRVVGRPGPRRLGRRSPPTPTASPEDQGQDALDRRAARGVIATAAGLATLPGGTKALGGGFSVPACEPATLRLRLALHPGQRLGRVVDATAYAARTAASMNVSVYCAGSARSRPAATAPRCSERGHQYRGDPAARPRRPLRGGGFATSTPIGGLAGQRPGLREPARRPDWISSAAAGGLSASSTLVRSRTAASYETTVSARGSIPTSISAKLADVVAVHLDGEAAGRPSASVEMERTAPR